MPPRPKSPAMRYRPATTVPGRKRPSSTLLVVLRWGTLEAPVPRTTVSAEVASSGAAQDEQKWLFWAHSCEQAGHRTMRSILARRGHRRTWPGRGEISEPRRGALWAGER